MQWHMKKCVDMFKNTPGDERHKNMMKDYVLTREDHGPDSLEKLLLQTFPRGRKQGNKEIDE